MSSGELADILRVLIKKRPDLKREAEEIAVEMISLPEIEDIAEDVFTGVTMMDIDDINERAGAHSWGYVGPDEAAWDLLEEAVTDFVADMKRRMELGLSDAALAICCGIVAGLHRAKGNNSDGPLGWSPDFPQAYAEHIVTEVIKSCPAENRADLGNRLVKALGDLVPQWRDFLARTAERASNKKSNPVG